MKMNIIFDYNRTLFDPEKGELFPNAYQVLKTLAEQHALFLFSYNEPTRDKFLKESGIEKFFTRIALVDEKTEHGMSSLIEEYSNSPTIVIGDRLKSEIIIAISLGYETVWLRQGKFASEMPSGVDENPTHTIGSIEEVLDIINKYK